MADTYVKDGQERLAYTPADAVKLRHDGWRLAPVETAPETAQVFTWGSETAVTEPNLDESTQEDNEESE